MTINENYLKEMKENGIKGIWRDNKTRIYMLGKMKENKTKRRRRAFYASLSTLN